MNDAEQLFDEMHKRSIVASHVSYNTLINGYCKVGEFDQAVKLNERMKMGNVEPNLVTFNTLLSGLRRSRRMVEAKKFFLEMKA
ncbi:hypothetical protein SLEP1_g47411 [Rubroshorea leprosula]|uniref:Pentatricopeptide repeat-containing protein n=1 Tax=Rubroshorea leprosula TaxID=152421 RepID=A0AAV5LRB3_9ROSI|nr:hypothetical protein SLEP1_g47411 [Rubroshorea leprosula]